MEIIHKKFDRAFQDFWKKHSILCILLIAALIFDTVSTIHFMQRDGIEFEMHPLVRASATLLGPVSGTILSAFFFRAVAGFFLAVYLRPVAVWVLVVPIITSTVAGFVNFFGYGIFHYYW